MTALDYLPDPPPGPYPDKASALAGVNAQGVLVQGLISRNDERLMNGFMTIDTHRIMARALNDIYISQQATLTFLNSL